MWLYAFLAQHSLKNYKTTAALEYIEKAIKHTPDNIEIQLIKAKILQFGGNREGAITCTETARNLDLRDRYLNYISSKYMLKNDDIS